MIYCFDLDGTLCHTENGEYANAQPFRDRIQAVNDLYDAGNIIVINTARGSVSKEDWYDRTAAQLLAWGLKWHDLYVGVKPHANFYVDDKGHNSEDFF